MKKINGLSAIALVSLLVSGVIYADEAADKTRLKLAQQVTELDGTIPSMQAIKTNMMKDMRASLPPYIKDDFVLALDEELNVQDLLLKTQQLYARTFTEAELKKWIDFYSTPEGKSIAGKMPMLSEDVIVLGQEWGKEAAERVLLLMQAKKQK